MKLKTFALLTILAMFSYPAMAVIPCQPFILKNGQPHDNMDCMEITDRQQYVAISFQGKFGIADRAGEVLVPMKYQEVNVDSNVAMFAVKDKGKWGYANDKGVMVVPLVYEEAFGFNTGLAGVKQNGKWGFIDSTGKMVIEPLYQEVSPFSNGLSAVKKDDKWGYIDNRGKTVIAFNYDVAYAFILYEKEVYAYVRQGEKYFYINKKGKKVNYSPPKQIPMPG